MTYKEAVAKKATIKSPYTKNGQTFNVFITPKKDSDNTKYLNEIRYNPSFVTDNYVIKYSTDSQFQIQGLCFTNVVIWDDLY